MQVIIHNRNYNSWEYTQDGVKVDLPHLIPSKHKLFHDDIIGFEDNVVTVIQSPLKTKILAGVLILGKTYGRFGKRLLYKCIPDNKSLPVFLVPYNVDVGFSKVIKNKYIVFRFTRWSEDHPHGEITETLGDVDSLDAFNEYQLHRRGLHLSLTPFAKAARNLLKDGIQKILTTTNIEDLRSINHIFTIDPANCTDFDDAFSASEENGIATVNVYIANVFVWLETYSLWEHMTDRVSTIYLPDKKRPMLPPILSDDLCSLKEGADRFAFMMSVQYDMRSLKQIGEPVFKNVLVHISKNYEYEDKKLEKNPAYKVLRTLAKTEDSHDVVAFWMIQMNAMSGEYLKQRSKGIFRTSTAPKETSPTVSQAMLHWLGNHSSSAIYSTVSAPHTQLGVNSYVHITSPIRRLVDILNQIQMNTEISESCQAFLDKWVQKLNDINHATKEIRKTQTDCELLSKTNFSENNEYSGILFDRTLVSGKYEYAVYIEELKMFSRIKMEECVENYTKSQFRIFVFEDEDRLCKKIQLRELVVFRQVSPF
jgi:exoribonuclease R